MKWVVSLQLWAVSRPAHLSDIDRPMAAAIECETDRSAHGRSTESIVLQASTRSSSGKLCWQSGCLMVRLPLPPSKNRLTRLLKASETMSIRDCGVHVRLGAILVITLPIADVLAAESSSAAAAPKTPA